VLRLSFKYLATNIDTLPARSATGFDIVPLTFHCSFKAVVTNAKTKVVMVLLGSTETQCPPLVSGCPTPCSEKASMKVDSTPLSRIILMFLMPDGSIQHVLFSWTTLRDMSMLPSFSLPAVALISLFVMLIVVSSVQPPVVVLSTSDFWIIFCLILLALFFWQLSGGGNEEVAIQSFCNFKQSETTNTLRSSL
jgi:hypothetical protein